MTITAEASQQVEPLNDEYLRSEVTHLGAIALIHEEDSTDCKNSIMREIRSLLQHEDFGQEQYHDLRTNLENLYSNTLEAIDSSVTQIPFIIN
jgi:hypothetical protein